MRAPSSRRQPRAWTIGVDLGGTWVRVLAVDSHGRRRLFQARTPGLAGLPAQLRSLWRRWGLRRNRVRALVVASRGVWTATERKILEERLKRLARRIQAIPDAQVAYHSALGEQPGVLILAGTGSMALARGASGQWSRAGGLGPLLGDEGSAFWIGREWLRARVRSEGVGPARGPLRSADPVARIAVLAPDVLDRARGGSRRARRIIAGAQEALADLLVAAAGEARLRGRVRVSWAGSLLEDARFRAAVWRAARRRGLAVRPERPSESPVAAAVRLASRIS